MGDDPGSFSLDAAVLPLAMGCCTLGGLWVQWLWNAAVSEVFETKPVKFWRAVLLLVLCKVLFGNEYNVNHTKGDRGNGWR